MTYPRLDADIDFDLDAPTGPAVVPGETVHGVLDAESDVGEWETPMAAAPARAATPRPGTRPGKAEVNAEHEARAERTRAGRRRRKVGGILLTTVIFASAAASVVGWPVVIAGLAATGGAAGVTTAAVKGVQNANGQGRGRRGVRNGGSGYGPGNRRPGLFGGRGRGAGGRGRGGGGGGLGIPNPFKGGTGRKAAAKKAAAGKGAAGGPTTGARSGPATGKKGGAHRPKKSTGGGLLGKLTGGGRHGGSGRHGGGHGRGGSRTRSRFGANNRRRQHQTPVRQQTRGGGPQQRTPRTFGGQVRQARRNAIRQQRQQLAQQVGQHRAGRRMQRRNGRVQRRVARQQARWTARQATILRRQQSRAAYRARVRARRLARAAPHRAWWRRRAILAAARARRRARNWVVRPIRRRGRQLRQWAGGRVRAGWSHVSPLYAIGRRAQLLALLRRLNPGFGAATARRPRWRGARYYTRLARGALGRWSRASWDATLGRMFVGLRRMLVAAAGNRRGVLAQLWRDFYAFLAQHAPHRTPKATPVPPRAAPAVPFRGMDPAERAALAAALGMAAGAHRAPTTRTAPRRPARPTQPTTARPRPSTRTPRPAMAVPVRPAVRTPRGTRPMVIAAQADAQEVTHPSWEAALSALNDSVATYQIPDDNTGVLDVDAFISSIGGYMIGLSTVLNRVRDYLAEGPTNVVVVEQLAEFSTATAAMAGDAAQVYEQWRTNEDNAHDLRRAEGEIQQAQLFNVGG